MLKDRYRIYDRLGSGGAANVYLGRDQQSGQMVVIKVVHNHLVNEKFMGRFQREIELLQKLHNPYIIELYDWALQEFDPETNQQLSYIVAEFVEGHTLADIVDTRGPLDEPTSLAIGRQVALGLSDVHRQGIVHRDIKSQNIMITPDNVAKIIDFPRHSRRRFSVQRRGRRQRACLPGWGSVGLDYIQANRTVERPPARWPFASDSHGCHVNRNVKPAIGALFQIGWQGRRRQVTCCYHTLRDPFAR